MRRVFAKGLACLHSLLHCQCEPQPITMHLRTPGRPQGAFVLLCASYTAHGREDMRRRFTYVSDTIERRVQRAVGYCVPKGERGTGLLVKTVFVIHPDGRVADSADRTIGFIGKFHR